MRKFCMKLWLTLVLGLCCVLTGCGNKVEKANDLMSNYIYNEALEQFNDNEIISDFSVKSITFDLGYDMGDYSQSDCIVQLESSALCKYGDVKENDIDKINEMLKVFRHIYNINHNCPYEKRAYTVGKKECKYNFLLSQYYNTLLISDTDGNLYEYGKDTDYEHLYLNDIVLFEELGEN